MLRTTTFIWLTIVRTLRRMDLQDPYRKPQNFKKFGHSGSGIRLGILRMYRMLSIFRYLYSFILIGLLRNSILEHSRLCIWPLICFTTVICTNAITNSHHVHPLEIQNFTSFNKVTLISFITPVVLLTPTGRSIWLSANQIVGTTFLATAKVSCIDKTALNELDEYLKILILFG